MELKNKPSGKPNYLKMFYGFLCAVVALIAFTACIVYSGPLYIIVSALTLMLLAVIIISSARNEKK